MLKFAAKLALLIVLVIGVTLVIDYGYRRTYVLDYVWPTNVWISHEIEDKYEIVILGNSHAEDGVTFDGYNLRGLDLAGVAQRFSYDLALLKQHQRQIADEAVILIDVSHISFSHRTADGDDGLQYNYFGVLSPFLIPDLQVSDYLQSQMAPFLRSGYLWRQAYGDEVKQRIADEEKWEEPELESAEASSSAEVVVAPAVVSQSAARPTASPDPVFSSADLLIVRNIEWELANPKVEDPGKFEENMHYLYKKWYETEEFDPQYFEGNRRDLEALIAYAHQQNWRPVLITIPVTQVLEDGLLDDYKQKYIYDNLAQTDLHGVEYIDFTDRSELTTNLSLFDNADHLNDKGAKVFSYLLLQELIEKGYLPPESDGYQYDQDTQIK